MHRRNFLKMLGIAVAAPAIAFKAVTSSQVQRPSPFAEIWPERTMLIDLKSSALVDEKLFHDGELVSIDGIMHTIVATP